MKYGTDDDRSETVFLANEPRTGVQIWLIKFHELKEDIALGRLYI